MALPVLVYIDFLLNLLEAPPRALDAARCLIGVFYLLKSPEEPSNINSKRNQGEAYV